MLVQKKDKLYFAGIILFGVLEALFIILQMYWISRIANAVFLQNMGVDTQYRAFMLLIICMGLAVVCGRIGSCLSDLVAFSMKRSLVVTLFWLMVR